MADFLPAITKTLAAEGGFFHNVKTGEVVNMGITLATLRSLGVLKSVGDASESDIQFVKSLAIDEARDIYREEYWDKLKLSQLNSQGVANKVFDLSVNMGTLGVTRILQKALGIPVDGIFGPKTMTAANAADPSDLLYKIRAQAKDFYDYLAQSNPLLTPNLTGWLNRLNS